jgi:hypothetical protein
MARHSIVEKLSALLGLPIESEVQVVYLLVELRKLLDHDSKKQTYEVLNFYGNWVVHIHLSKSPFADKIVRMFDDLFSGTVNGAVEPDMLERVNNLVSHTLLQTEMKAYLETLDLPTTVCTSPDEWNTFCKHLGNVIEDCPLRLLPTAKHGPTRFVREVIVHSKPPDGYGVTCLEWKPTLHTVPKVVVRRNGRVVPQS